MDANLVTTLSKYEVARHISQVFCLECLAASNLHTARCLLSSPCAGYWLDLLPGQSLSPASETMQASERWGRHAEYTKPLRLAATVACNGPQMCAKIPCMCTW